MKKGIGMILLLLGFILTLIFGMQYVGGSEGHYMFGFELEFQENTHLFWLIVGTLSLIGGIYLVAISRRKV